jgi:hypothetical protein
MRRLYGGKDFNTARAEIAALLDKNYKELGIDLNFTNRTTTFLIDLAAYCVENIAFFQDVRANEAFLETVQKSTALAKIAAEYGYNPYGATAASGTVRIRPDRAYAGTIYLQAGLVQFSSTGGVYAETTEDVIWLPNETGFKDVPVSQVRTLESVFRGTGERFQRLGLPVADGNHVVYRASTVTVDGQAWLEVDRIEPDAKEVFLLRYLDAPPSIEFGDGAVGSIPSVGAEIRATYKTTLGLAGNIVAGLINKVVTPVSAAGEAVTFVFDATSGALTGGDAPQTIEQIRAVLPDRHHADGSVVTAADVESIISNFRDPLFGSVAKASAFVATGIDNDIEARTLIEDILIQLMDATSTLTSFVADVSSANANLQGFVVDITNATTAIDAITDPSSGDIEGSLADIDALLVSTDTSTERIKRSATAITSSQAALQPELDNADTASATIRSTLAGVAAGPSDQLTVGTASGLTTQLNNLDSALGVLRSLISASGVVAQQANEINAEATTVFQNTSDTATALAAVRAALVTVDSLLGTINAAASDVAQEGTDLVADTVSFETTLGQPWVVATALTNDLRDHLDAILTDECGPNVVSLLVLSFDADRFYTAPSNALLQAIESYIEKRREPSVVFRVLDGSDWLVRPAIEVVFEPQSGYSPSKQRSQMEALLLANLKESAFGAPLYLDDLYATLRAVQGVQSLNVAITGRTARPSSSSALDAYGNLRIEQGEVITRGTIRYFRRFPNGVTEEIL